MSSGSGMSSGPGGGAVRKRTVAALDRMRALLEDQLRRMEDGMADGGAEAGERDARLLDVISRVLHRLEKVEHFLAGALPGDTEGTGQIHAELERRLAALCAVAEGKDVPGGSQ